MGNWVNGLTLDQVPDPDKIITILRGYSKPVTLRIVFDEGVPAKDYLDAIKKITPVCAVMGQLLDSSAMAQYTLAQYTKRANEYLSVLGNYVNLWEIGNEINGDWLGKQPGAKALAAHQVFKGAGKKTALTGYYNCQCEDKNGPMLKWLEKNIDPQLKREVDYFLISYYEDDCNNRGVLPSEWDSVFNQCSTLFPNSLLGMGECGTTRKAYKSVCMTRYYTMRLSNPRFIGGFFWWYGHADVISTTRLRKTFGDLIV